MSAVASAASVTLGGSAWLLTAPWWHWTPGSAEAGAELQPALQKYASADLVTDFLADPQHRLAMTPLVDQTQPPVWNPASLQPVAHGSTEPLTKIYLPVHARHYLVAVEVHCDQLGLPAVCRDEICEAGFVVRRRWASLAPEDRPEARRRLRALARLRATIGVLDRRLRQATTAGRIGLAHFTAIADRRARLATDLARAEADLRAWAGSVGAQRQLQGWVRLGVDSSGVPQPLGSSPEVRPLSGLGRWVPVEEVPQDVSELVHPLYPAIPDPTRPASAVPARHDADGRTIFYGMLPTTSSELELEAGVDPSRANRLPRFDDLSIYEVRCFVRRHDPACQRRTGRQDCCGPITYSAPTAGYRLANVSDPRGTANRPVTVRLPSRQDLEDAAAGTLGFGGMKVASPDITVDPNGGANFQICAFGIPLITIVATFVIKLFLPIVTFLLGLWVLLALRLCIPPSVDVDAGAKADLDAIPPGTTIDQQFAAQFNLDHAAAIGSAFAGLTAGQGKAGMKPDPAMSFKDSVTDPLKKFQLFRALAQEEFRSPTDDLLFAPRVERSMVPVP